VGSFLKHCVALRLPALQRRGVLLDQGPASVPRTVMILSAHLRQAVTPTTTSHAIEAAAIALLVGISPENPSPA
jgi:hypothetical protein